VERVATASAALPVGSSFGEELAVNGNGLAGAERGWRITFLELEMKEIGTCHYTLVLQHDAEESPLHL